MVVVTLGRLAILQQKVQRALSRFEESLALTRQENDDLSTTIALHHLGWAQLLLEDVAGAGHSFGESLRLSLRLRHADGIAYGLEGLVAIAAVTGDLERAGRLLGASQALREQTGLYNAPTFSFHEQLLGPALAGEFAPVLEAARAAGRELSQDAAVALALEVAASASVAQPAQPAAAAASDAASDAAQSTPAQSTHARGEAADR